MRVQNPVDLNDLSEPQPDLTLLRRRQDYYRRAHPAPEDILLMVEVSDGSASWDRRVKRGLYAAAGVGELWIVDLARGVIEVATDPSPSGYRSLRTVRPGDALAPMAFPSLSVPTDELLR